MSISALYVGQSSVILALSIRHGWTAILATNGCRVMLLQLAQTAPRVLLWQQIEQPIEAKQSIVESFSYVSRMYDRP
jgi:hypothetical protein